MVEKLQKLKQNMSEKIIWKESFLDDLLIALLSGGHVLLEDVPGVGKTTIARTFAASLALSFVRLQMTPDTLASDITGASIFSASTGEFTLKLGPIMNHIVLTDELNRTSPKTQAALLEAMEERQVTIDGKSFPLPDPFLLIATQNPVSSVGVYALPEAQLDRFLMKLSVGYPDTDASVELGKRFLDGALEQASEPVLTKEEILSMKQKVREVRVPEELLTYGMRLAEATRHAEGVLCGCSPRASLDLLRASQAKAFLSGREYVVAEDLIDMAKTVWPHRIRMTAEAEMARRTGRSAVEYALSQVAVPV